MRVHHHHGKEHGSKQVETAAAAVLEVKPERVRLQMLLVF